MKPEIKTTLSIATVLLSFALGFSIRSEYIFKIGKQQGRDDFIKLISDLGMEGKSIYSGLAIGPNKWMNVKYQVITPSLTSQEASNLWFAYQFAKTNNFSIAITNLSGRTITIQMPGAKEDKP